ncbi:MAG: peptide chain release factor N(5)-glutamine methyltransferase [Actinomycetota bacterium]|nr:peptide chain release factor N(5)-glutamine methyltransferase [Actinomycetota bacterium]
MRTRDVLLGVDELPRHEAVRLLMLATGRTRPDVLLGFDVTPVEREAFASFVERRRSNEPLQYIEGIVAFGPVELQVELRVDDRVLIPRPETEYLFEQVVEIVDNPGVIIDLCTGSGNLALALKAAFPTAEVYAVELSPDAADVARENAIYNNLDVDVLVGDLFGPLPGELMGTVDLVVSNPPYLARHELVDLPRDVLAEPEMALIAGETGDEVLAKIADGAYQWLAPGGVVACEISEFQGLRAAVLFDRYDASIVEDLTGRVRYVIGSRGFE